MHVVVTETSDELFAKLSERLGRARIECQRLAALSELDALPIPATGRLVIRGDLLERQLLDASSQPELDWLALLPPGDLDMATSCGRAGALRCFDYNALDALTDWLQKHAAASAGQLHAAAAPEPGEARLKIVPKPQPQQTLAPAGLIGECPAMVDVYQRIEKVGPTQSTVLIRGETGTGKELCARAIHNASGRRDQPFVAVNCAAIPETLIESELFGHEKGSFTGASGKRIGLIEEAEGGSLFLDEIGELPSEAQARLLRFIQESEVRAVGSNKSRKVDVRLIAATHRDLQGLSRSGSFRADLYYRINVFRIFLPRLRDRGTDIFLLAEHLLSKASLKHDKPGLYLTPEAIDAIRLHRWEGNVRELENTIERAAIMASGLAIDPHCLEIEVATPSAQPPISPSSSQASVALDQAADEVVSSITSHHEGVSLEEPSAGLSLEDYFQQFVIENQGQMNETELAKKLGISRKCLWERRQRFGIPRDKAKQKSESRGNK